VDRRRFAGFDDKILALHARLRNILKTRGHFPTDEATKLLRLALHNTTAPWGKEANYRRSAAINSRSCMVTTHPAHRISDTPMRLWGRVSSCPHPTSGRA
jgi:hypothetical protein